MKFRIMKQIGLIGAAIIAGLLMCACQNHEAKSTGNAVYYWRTTLQLNDEEREFLARNNVEKIYMRYFDVVRDYKGDSAMAFPNATIQWRDTLPDGIEVVPVVFITPEAANVMSKNMDVYTRKFVARVKAMSHSQRWPIKEIQLDCDWTESTRDCFYGLCRSVRESLKADGIKLSATIRLHQLAHQVPPVDRGVLMVYNTGSFKSISTKNSIFNPSDIEPYLRYNRLKKYKLPLDVAWPAYGWSVAFDRNDNFIGLLHTTDFSDVSEVGALRKGRCEVHSYVQIEGKWLSSGSHIRVERPSAKEVAEIKALINQQLGSEHSNIIYHLDSKQLKNYRNNEIKNIFAAD